MAKIDERFEPFEECEDTVETVRVIIEEIAAEVSARLTRLNVKHVDPAVCAVFAHAIALVSSDNVRRRVPDEEIQAYAESTGRSIARIILMRAREQMRGLQ
jgi:hypothetical protein